MNKTKELIEIINNHQDHKLIFMYPDEGSDHAYTMGHPSKILVDEYWTDDDRVWLRFENEDEMFEHYAENIFIDLYPNEDFANEEQENVINKQTKEFIDGQNWKKCVCVYIHY